MTRAGVVWVVAGVVAVVAVGVLATVRGGAAAETRRAGPDVNGEFPPADRMAIQQVAARFAITISDEDPGAHALAPAESRLVTPAFGRELRAQRRLVTAAESTATKRLAVESVAVRPGRPPTALVLGTLVVTAPGELPVRAPVTWLLTVVGTTGEWRVAAATS